MSEPTSDAVLRERLDSVLVDMPPQATIPQITDALLPVVEERVADLQADRDRLRTLADQARERAGHWLTRAQDIEEDRDRLVAKVEALEANYGQVAADAMAHGLCHMKLGGVLNRAEAAEADRDRLAAAVARAEAYAHELSHKDATGLLAALDGSGEA